MREPTCCGPTLSPPTSSPQPQTLKEILSAAGYSNILSTPHDAELIQKALNEAFQRGRRAERDHLRKAFMIAFKDNLNA